jgi:hypothetical protein
VPAPASLEVVWDNGAFASDVQLFPENTIDGVDVGLIDLGNPADFGRIPWHAFEEARPLLDGMSYYGGVFSAGRDVKIPLWCKCGNAKKALDQIRVIDKWFTRNTLSDMQLKVDRLDASDATIETKLNGYLVDNQAFVNSPAPGVGVIGDMDVGQLLYILTLRCPYPHFIDRGVSSESGSWSSGTETETVTVDGPNAVGIKATISSAVSVSSVTITNATTGRYVTLTDTYAASVVIDWYGSDPNELSVYRGSTDLLGNCNVGALLRAEPGANSFEITATGTSFDYSLEWYEKYDSI